MRSEENDKKSVDLFSQDMLDKLRKNAHKPHHSVHSLPFLVMRLKEEVVELEEEVDKFLDGASSAEAVVKECADVSNFSMFIAENVRTEEL